MIPVQRVRGCVVFVALVGFADAGTVTSKPTTKNPAPTIDQPETRTQTHQRTAHKQKLNSSFCSEVVRQTVPSCRERRSLSCTTALECHCCLLLLGTACCLHDLLQAHFFRSVAVSSTAVPWLARVPLLLKLRSSVVSQQKCASNRRAVLSTK